MVRAVRAAIVVSAVQALMMAGITIPAVASPAPALAATGRVWVQDCPFTRFEMQPVRFVVACADDGIFFRHLSWAGWGGASTTGTGILVENTCDPTCSAGRYVSEPGTLTLSQIGRYNGRRAYDYAEVHPSKPNRHGLPSFGYELTYS